MKVKMVFVFILLGVLVGCGDNSCCKGDVPNTASIGLAAGGNEPPEAKFSLKVATPEEVEQARLDGTLHIVGDPQTIEANTTEDNTTECCDCGCDFTGSTGGTDDGSV